MALFVTKYSSAYIKRRDADELWRVLGIWLQTYGQKPAEEFATRIRIHAEKFPVATRKLEEAFPDIESRTVVVCEMIDMLFFLLAEKHQDIDELLPLIYHHADYVPGYPRVKLQHLRRRQCKAVIM